MYRLQPSKVYYLDEVERDPRAVARMERMVAALDPTPPLERITEQNLPDVMAEIIALKAQAAGNGHVGSYASWRRPLIFTNIAISEHRNLAELLPRCPKGTTQHDLAKVYGHMALAIDQHPHERDRHDNTVCWPTINFGTMIGCPHACAYCGEGRTAAAVSVGVNLEEYIDRIVGPMIEYNPWNRVFRMILNGSDLITFEPEYGLFDLFTRKLAEFEGRYGHFHTISSNVDWLADLEHRDRLVGVWSTTCEAVARDIEPGAGSAYDRYDSAARVQAMGIPVRYKYKPIIPVRNWREEYGASIEQALKRTKPESIGFCLYIWNTFESMSRTLPLDLLDPECVDAARCGGDEVNGTRHGPFPHATRLEIYRTLIREVRRWDDEAKLYVCTESRQMWNDLSDELGQDPKFFFCGCGSMAMPGGQLGINPGLKYSTYHPTPV